MAGKLPAVLLTFLVTGAVVGGGVYFYENKEIGKLTQQQQALQKEIDQLKKETPANNTTGIHVAVQGEQVLTAFKNGDFAKLSTYIHPDKGVRFSPYAYVNNNADQKFTASQIKGMAGSTTVYNWGSYDGSGKPIELTFSEYVKKFVYDQDFLQAKQVSFNHPIGTGNTQNNAAKVYPNATIIEYHFPGFDPKVEGMDWKSLRLVFEQKNGVWYLVGVIHAQWTV